MGRGAAREPLADLRILEPGLWSKIPAEIWAMETRLIERQASDFRLLAPDEPKARAGYEAEHPQLLNARLNSLSQMFPKAVAADEPHPDDPGDDDDPRDDDQDDD
jgi:hypothetical protein